VSGGREAKASHYRRSTDESRAMPADPANSMNTTVKIVLVAGARPNFMKIAPLLRARGQ